MQDGETNSAYQRKHSFLYIIDIASGICTGLAYTQCEQRKWNKNSTNSTRTKNARSSLFSSCATVTFEIFLIIFNFSLTLKILGVRIYCCFIYFLIIQLISYGHAKFRKHCEKSKNGPTSKNHSLAVYCLILVITIFENDD